MSARPFLLDTSVLLHLARGKQLGLYIDKTYNLSQAVHRPLVSIVSHGELWVLADRNNWGQEKRQALSGMLDNMVTIDLNDHTVIQAYVEVERASQNLAVGSRILSNNDLWIAACTKAADAILFNDGQRLFALASSPLRCDLHRSTKPATSDDYSTQPKIQ